MSYRHWINGRSHLHRDGFRFVAHDVGYNKNKVRSKKKTFTKVSNNRSSGAWHEYTNKPSTSQIKWGFIFYHWLSQCKLYADTTNGLAWGTPTLALLSRHCEARAGRSAGSWRSGHRRPRTPESMAAPFLDWSPSTDVLRAGVACRSRKRCSASAAGNRALGPSRHPQTTWPSGTVDVLGHPRDLAWNAPGNIFDPWYTLTENWNDSEIVASLQILANVTRTILN